MIKKVVFIVIVAVLCFSCKQVTWERSRVPVAEIEGSFLYADELIVDYPINCSSEDSLRLKQLFIKKWATDNLLLKDAQENSDNLNEIDQLVKEYRKTLIINQFQENMVRSQLAYPNDQSVEEYYTKLKPNLRLDEPILKGLMIVVPKDGVDIEAIRKAFKHFNEDQMEVIEQFSLTYALQYDYFRENWRTLSYLNQQLPNELVLKNVELKRKGFYELSDSVTICLLYVDESLSQGSIMPLTYAKEKIRSMLYNKMKLEFLKSLSEDIYQQGEKAQMIHYFDEKMKVQNNE